MRTQQQLHNQKGEFVKEPDIIPEGYVKVQADFLTPHEKEILRLLSKMEETEDERVLNDCFINAVKTLTSLHGERLQVIGPERPDDVEDCANQAKA